MNHSLSISPLVRAALMVRDLERSRRFYQELLGLAEHYLPATDLTATIAWKLLGLPAGTPYRGTILKVPGPNYGMVGLFEIAAGCTSELVPPRERIALGESILVFYCADLARVLADLERYGGRLLAPPQRFEIAGSDAPPITEVIVRDPDGFAVSLNDASPALAFDDAPVSLG